MNALATLTEPGHTAAAPSQGLPVRVVVLTASVGAGHDGPAREIARRLIAAGHQADVVDLVDLAPAGTGRMLRNAFHAQLAWAPDSWGRLYDATNRAAGTRRSGLATLVRPLARPLARIIAGGPAAPAAAVVSTYPLAGHAVAAARRLASVSVPLISYVTDPAAHASWVVPGTDLYLTGWATTAVQLWQYGPAPVRVINPLVRSEFHRPADPVATSDIRYRFGLPPGSLALVMSGSWAVGDVAATVDDLLAVGGASPVVVCGRNERLRRRMARRPGVTALGWVSDMAGLMRVCDVAVLNSGGLSLAEATAVGLPVLHYRPLVGQGVANAALADAVGLAEWPRSRPELSAAIARTAMTVRRFVEAPVDPVTEIITVARAGSGWPVEFVAAAG